MSHHSHQVFNRGRFSGNSSVFVANGRTTRGWKIECSKCPAHKIITTEQGLHPDMIMKKLRQSGWQIGRNPKDDMCPLCILKDRKKPSAPKPVREEPDPVDLRQCILKARAAISASKPHRATHLLEVALTLLDAPPPPSPPPPPPPPIVASITSPIPATRAPSADEAYDQWLASLEKK